MSNAIDVVKQEGLETFATGANVLQYVGGWFMNNPEKVLLILAGLMFIKNKGKIQIGKTLKVG